MRVSVALCGAGVAAALASNASARVVALQVSYDGFIGGRHVWSVYATATDNNNVLLNVLNHSVVLGSMADVQHNDTDVLDGGPGTWNPSFTIGNTQRANDSYVTVTGLTGSSAATNLDPSFGAGMGSQIPEGAGWFTANPGTPILFTGGRVKIMQLAGARLGPAFGVYMGRMTIGYKLNSSSDTPLYAENLTYGWLPAPGALALLGVAVAAGRDRRR